MIYTFFFPKAIPSYIKFTFTSVATGIFIGIDAITFGAIFCVVICKKKNENIIKQLLWQAIILLYEFHQFYLIDFKNLTLSGGKPSASW